MREQARNRLAGDGITSLLPQLNLAPRENTHITPPHTTLACSSPLPPSHRFLGGHGTGHRSLGTPGSGAPTAAGRLASQLPIAPASFPGPKPVARPVTTHRCQPAQDHELARHSARSCFVSPPTYIAPWLKQLRGGLPNCPVPICPWAVKNKRVRQAALGSNQNSRANSKQGFSAKSACLCSASLCSVPADCQLSCHSCGVGGFRLALQPDRESTVVDDSSGQQGCDR